MITGTPQATVTDAERGLLAREVRRTIVDIAKTRFECDPLVVPDASLAASEISSAYKRHGLILETALLVSLATRADLKVWTDKLEVRNRRRPIQVDLIVYSVPDQALTAYEIKRGFGAQDSEARLSIEERMSSLEAMLLTYGSEKGVYPVHVSVAVIGYYGRLGARVGPHRVVDQHGLAKEFDTETAAFVREVIFPALPPAPYSPEICACPGSDQRNRHLPRGSGPFPTWKPYPSNCHRCSSSLG